MSQGVAVATKGRPRGPAPGSVTVTSAGIGQALYHMGGGGQIPGVNWGILAPDVMLPGMHAPSAIEYSGEHLLLFTVLLDAIQCSVDLRNDKARRLARAEARDWIVTNRGAFPFMFEVICELFGIDIDAAREGLARTWAAVDRRLWEE